MAVKKVGDKWEVNGTEYDSEAKANAAYQATIALKFGVPTDDKKKAPKKKTKKTKAEADAEEHTHED